MPEISVIIPTRGRKALLAWTLEAYHRQILRPDLFEIIVVHDGEEPAPVGDTDFVFTAIRTNEKSGPATARNVGAKAATGNVLVFAGDDCLPDRNFLWRHHAAHRRSDEPVAVQGYSPWHPDIPPDDFMNFLVSDSGLQANWNALKNDNGSWKPEASGWFMTTNCSVARSLFESESGFDERFPDPAWEDIELGYRFAKRSVKTLFEPDAVNYHHHRVTLDSFSRRQQMEGRSRLYLCAAHVELSWNMLDPAGLRATNDDMLPEALAVARELHYNDGPDVQDTRRQRWAAAMRLASLSGIRAGINERGGVWLAVPHLHTAEECNHVVGAAAALENNDPTYAALEAQWALRENAGDWALNAANGEVLLALGDRPGAEAAFREAVRLGPGEKWPLGRLEETQSG